ncbi:MAG TPA: penicillin-binding protein 2 [Alphaproteobacteria bacterium]
MKKDDVYRTRLFTRRTALLAGGQLALFGGLIGRMYYLQVVESDRYKMLADDNRISLRLLPPPRGRILDRYGDPIAINQLNYRVVVIPEQTGSVPATLDAISEIVPITEFERRRIMREIARKRKFLPVIIKENLAWEDVARVAVNAPDLPGVMIDVGSSRFYPTGERVAHVIGYVAPPSEADLTGDPLLELPDFRIGRNGVERVYDLALRGRAGSSQIEVNALGRPIRELARQEGQPGTDLVLSLDLKLQTIASERLATQESAAAVVMDVTTGEVLVLASSPSFDPNEFNKGISGATWRELIGNSRSPLTNKCASGQYAPGSTFKPVVAMAALESGLITPEFRVSCPGHYDLGNAKFHCWKKGGHGSVDMVDAIKGSCDVYFYEVARRIGIDRIAEMAKRFGLGQTLGFDVPGERAGLIPTRAWKMATTGVPWQTGENLVAGIGQGYVLATPLQLAVMCARVANGGYAVMPRLARDRVDGNHLGQRPPATFAPIGVSQTNLAVVARGMRGVVNDPRGTAFRARIMDATMAMAGKSGTSQVRRITEEERRAGLRKPEQVPWKERDNALFIAFAPVDNPRYACAVIVEHGIGGSAVAAPIVRDLLIEAQKREREKLPAAQHYAAATPTPGTDTR